MLSAPIAPQRAARLLLLAARRAGTLQIDEPRALRAKETPLHAAADRQVPAIGVALRYAFMMGRRAQKVGQDAADAVRSALEDVLPATLAKALAAGGGVALGRLSSIRVAESCPVVRSGQEQYECVLPARHSGECDFSRLATLRTAAPKLKIKFDATNPNAARWAEKRAAELAKDISETTRDRIARGVARQQETGESSYDEILAAVGDEDRATLIARHESMVAASEGQRQGWDQAVGAGLLTGDERRAWIIVGDEKVCPICEDLDGKTAPLDGEYEPGIEGPPAHVQCRCTEGIGG